MYRLKRTGKLTPRALVARRGVSWSAGVTRLGWFVKAVSSYAMALKLECCSGWLLAGRAGRGLWLCASRMYEARGCLRDDVQMPLLGTYLCRLGRRGLSSIRLDLSDMVVEG